MIFAILSIQCSWAQSLERKIEFAIIQMERHFYRHETMSREEVINDYKDFITSKGHQIPEKKLDKFNADASVFMTKIEELESINDILLLEYNIINELSTYETWDYFSCSEEVTTGSWGGLPGLIVGIPVLAIGLSIDLISSPVILINNEIVQRNKTKWSRRLAAFLIKY